MDRLVKFLRRLVEERFFGAVTLRFQAGKLTHVETNGAREVLEYKDLPS